ncbi:MAG: helix-turn-helix domain-containing protein [Trueperaceae bacterium]|nr:helix-turn-helix domain-containing protein [Trueperaceae bacterium]
MDNTPTPHDQPRRLLTTKEVAARLTLSPRTVRDMCDRGELEHVRIGAGSGQQRTTYRIKPESLDQLLGGRP